MLVWFGLEMEEIVVSFLRARMKYQISYKFSPDVFSIFLTLTFLEKIPPPQKKKDYLINLKSMLFIVRVHPFKFIFNKIPYNFPMNFPNGLSFWFHSSSLPPVF